MTGEIEVNHEGEAIKSELLGAISRGDEVSPKLAELFKRACERGVRIGEEIASRKKVKGEEGITFKAKLESLTEQVLSSGDAIFLENFWSVVRDFPLLSNSPECALASLKGELKIVSSGDPDETKFKNLQGFDTFTNVDSLMRMNLYPQIGSEGKNEKYQKVLNILYKYGANPEAVNKLFEDLIILGKGDRVFALIGFARRIDLMAVAGEVKKIVAHFLNFDRERISSVCQKRMEALFDIEWETNFQVVELMDLQALVVKNGLTLDKVQLRKKVQAVFETKCFEPAYLHGLHKLTQGKNESVYSYLFNEHVDGLGLDLDYNETVGKNLEKNAQIYFDRDSGAVDNVKVASYFVQEHGISGFDARNLKSPNLETTENGVKLTENYPESLKKFVRNRFDLLNKNHVDINGLERELASAFNKARVEKLELFGLNEIKPNSEEIVIVQDVAKVRIDGEEVEIGIKVRVEIYNNVEVANLEDVVVVPQSE